MGTKEEDGVKRKRTVKSSRWQVGMHRKTKPRNKVLQRWWTTEKGAGLDSERSSCSGATQMKNEPQQYNGRTKTALLQF